MKFCSVRDLRINASRVVRRARRERVVITVRGQPTAFLVPIQEKDFDALELDLYPELKRSLEEAEAAIDHGKGIHLAEVKRYRRKRG